MKNTYYKLGLNIRGLRKFYGLTQEELAFAVGLTTKQAISQYELGDSIPERDILQNICRFFRITVDELLYGNYSEIKKVIDAPIYQKQYQSAMFDNLLPLVCSDSALENSFFKEAYDIHQILYKSILNGEGCNQALIDKCMNLYDKACEEGVIEGVANSLWWIMFFGLITTLSLPQMIEKLELLRCNKIKVHELFKDIFLRPVDMDISSDDYKTYEKTQAEFLDENMVSIFVRIRQLKNSNKYADLGDYYLAFIYLFNLIINTQSAEQNSSMGIEMMNTYSILGNVYAQKFRNKSTKN